MFINVGASKREDNTRFRTKKALKEALGADPSSVLFDRTSFLDDGLPPICGDDIPPGAKLTVVGPDPYVSRKWYATVEISNGQVKVS